jgi:hypothetical protein
MARVRGRRAETLNVEMSATMRIPILRPPARIHLFGHPSKPAHLEVAVYPGWARLARTIGFLLAWIVGSTLTLVFTFDPFVASFPFTIGGWLVYRSWRGRYRVHAFRGACPRCDQQLAVPPGSKIDLPYSLVCYQCHFEPELAV